MSPLVEPQPQLSTHQRLRGEHCVGVPIVLLVDDEAQEYRVDGRLEDNNKERSDEVRREEDHLQIWKRVIQDDMEIGKTARQEAL